MAALLSLEVPGLPVGGPVSLAELKDELRIPADDTEDDTILNRILLGVNRKVRRWPIAGYASQPDVVPEDRVWPEDIVQGAVMLASRLSRRRNSPAGFEAFAGEGAVYVQRNDPDIAQMLELGSYAAPMVG